MTVSGNAHLHEQAKLVMAIPPAASPATTEDAVSMRGADRCTIIILLDTGTSPNATTVTLKQSTVVALTDEKALAFTEYWLNADTAASDTLVETAVTANTFDFGATTDKLVMAVIEVKGEDLDIANNFDVLRVDVTGGTVGVLSAVYILYPAKYGAADPKPSAIID